LAILSHFLFGAGEFNQQTRIYSLSRFLGRGSMMPFVSIKPILKPFCPLEMKKILLDWLRQQANRAM